MAAIGTKKSLQHSELEQKQSVDDVFLIFQAAEAPLHSCYGNLLGNYTMDTAQSQAADSRTFCARTATQDFE